MVIIECFRPYLKMSLPEIIFPRPILKMQSKFQMTNIFWSDIIHTYFVFLRIHPNSTGFGVFDYKTIFLGFIPTIFIGFRPASCFFFQSINTVIFTKKITPTPKTDFYQIWISIEVKRQNWRLLKGQIISNISFWCHRLDQNTKEKFDKFGQIIR